MSGIPRPVDDLPAGHRFGPARSRRSLEQHPGPSGGAARGRQGRGRSQTDEGGRAQFSGLTPGATLKAVAVVDGERLESQEFPAPLGGGIRVMLVATDKEKEARAAEAAKAPAVTGRGRHRRRVAHRRSSRTERNVRVYYLLDITNTAAGAGQSPDAIQRSTYRPVRLARRIMEARRRRRASRATRVQVQGPFAPGTTFVQVGVRPAGRPAVASRSRRRFPPPLEHLAVIVKKVGDARLTSPQIARQQEMPAKGRAVHRRGRNRGGRGRAAGGAHASRGCRTTARYPATSRSALALGHRWPRRLVRPTPARPRAAAAPRASALIARREKLFQDLVRLEADIGAAAATRRAIRRAGRSS